jgi:hypothetical protein
MKKKQKALTSYQLFYTLKGIYDNDCYLEEFLDEDVLEDFLTTLVDYNILFVASDDRILLTNSGEKFLQKLMFHVEFSDTYVNLYSK